MINQKINFFFLIVFCCFFCISSNVFYLFSIYSWKNFLQLLKWILFCSTHIIYIYINLLFFCRVAFSYSMLCMTIESEREREIEIKEEKGRIEKSVSFSIFFSFFLLSYFCFLWWKVFYVVQSHQKQMISCSYFI